MARKRKLNATTTKPKMFVAADDQSEGILLGDEVVSVLINDFDSLIERAAFDALATLAAFEPLPRFAEVCDQDGMPIVDAAGDYVWQPDPDGLLQCDAPPSALRADELLKAIECLRLALVYADQRAALGWALQVGKLHERLGASRFEEDAVRGRKIREATRKGGLLQQVESVPKRTAALDTYFEAIDNGVERKKALRLASEAAGVSVKSVYRYLSPPAAANL